MNIVTFDSSAVLPEIHQNILTLLTTLGYVTVVQENEVSSSEIFILTQFDIPYDSTITLASKGLSKSEYCQEKMTDSNFGTPLPKGPVAGGFFPMGINFESKDGIKAIEALAIKHKRKFRVGTTHEALLFKKKYRNLCPRYFVVLGKVWNSEILYWRYNSLVGFDLGHLDDEWSENFQVFFVEDLEPLVTSF